MQRLLLFLLPALLATGCASKAPKAVVQVHPSPAGRNLNNGETRVVRHPEILKAYPLGRYVDPNNRKVMHEAHTIYRVESTAKWNLANSASPVVVRSYQPSDSEPTRNELLVELNRQREATRAVMRSGQTVSAKLTELTQALQQNRILAEQNANIQKELTDTRSRLKTLEQKERASSSSTPETTMQLEDAPW
ncbi:hypothetical protein FEM03_07260 [Phragmitibacter flavus]|uniref:Uncharacterized protein n=1 Tax=Phragmitibacter flavus TaxID=2576071 RepID=A0A5R8KGG2_9BACT|nr:hypothetical protein [Phragmitibacter flavus]TLD71321.1 hypothetical protein FEM03_07260 [Phragmitibacter flavus]